MLLSLKYICSCRERIKEQPLLPVTTSFGEFCREWGTCQIQNFYGVHRRALRVYTHHLAAASAVSSPSVAEKQISLFLGGFLPTNSPSHPVKGRMTLIRFGGEVVQGVAGEGAL